MIESPWLDGLFWISMGLLVLILIIQIMFPSQPPGANRE